MSAPNPKLYEEGTTTAMGAETVGTVFSPGTSSEVEFDFANEGALADPIEGAAIGMMESDDAGVTWYEGAAAIEGWIEVQAYDVAVDAGSNDIAPQTTSWTPVGRNRRLQLLDIPGGTRRKLRARLNVATGSSAGKLFKIIGYYRANYNVISQGFHEAGIRGVVSGAGDDTFFGLIQGGTPEASGTPDGDLQIVDTTVARAYGVPYVKYAHAIPIAASASGNARWVLVCWDGFSPDFELVESTEVTAPAPVEDKPELPAERVLIADVHRDDGTIASGDIYTDRRTLVPFGLEITGGLNFTVGPGQAVTKNSLVALTNSSPGTLVNNTDNYVTLTGTGGVVVSNPTASGNEPLWYVRTSAGAVVEVRDLRNWLVRGGLWVAEFRFDDEPTVGDYRYWTAPRETYIQFHAPEALRLSVGDMGDRTTGDLTLDLEYYDNGTSSWVSCFSDAAERPTIPATATDAALVASGFFADFTNPAPVTRFRAKIAAKPTGGTAGPTGIVLRALFELSGY